MLRGLQSGRSYVQSPSLGTGKDRRSADSIDRHARRLIDGGAHLGKFGHAGGSVSGALGLAVNHVLHAVNRDQPKCLVDVLGCIYRLYVRLALGDQGSVSSLLLLMERPAEERWQAR